MTKHFKDFIDYNKRIGKMIIAGVEGAGKTELLAMILIGKMLHGMEDCWKSYDTVDEYNALGFNFSKNYEHLAFSNIDVNCEGTNIPDRKVYKCNPYRLGLFDPLYDTDYYPPYSLFGLTEGYNFLNAYLYNKFREGFRGWLKTCRQSKYDMVVDTHAFEDICTIFRRLTNRFIYLYKPVEDIKNRDGVIIGHRFFVKEWKTNRDAMLFEGSNKEVNCETYDLVVNMCLHDNYDTEYCKYLHLQGRKFQDFVIQNFPKIEKAEDLENFGEEFGIIPPEGFFVSNNKSSFGDKDKDVLDTPVDWEVF